jgi:hypothetical protein
MKIQSVSSRWTFLLKLAFPLLWLIFMGGVSLIIILSPLENIQEPFSPLIAKTIVLSFYFSVLVMLYSLFANSKWVGVSESHIYISNYFKSMKYTFESIEKYEEVNMIIFTKVILHFHQPGVFGQKVYFIKSHYWKYFLKKYPMFPDNIKA